jgi:hypothetical protein
MPMKNAVFWYVTPCGFCKNGSVLRWLVTAIVVPSSPILDTMMESVSPSEMYVPTRATRRHIPEGDMLHSHRRENLKSYIALTSWDL